MRPFLERLNELESTVKRPTSRRIAELLPDIEAARAKGFSRAQIVEALKAEGIEITVSMLSTYLHRLKGSGPRKPQEAVPTAPETKSGSATGDPNFKYGAHDPRRLDEIMRTPPDMKALAKQAKKGKP